MECEEQQTYELQDAPDTRTRWEKMIGRLYKQTQSFATSPGRLRGRLADCAFVDAPRHFKGCIFGQSVTKFSLADRLRILVTGTVVTNWIHRTENEPGKNVTNAKAYVSWAKDRK
jgi:hypothetical protein